MNVLGFACRFILKKYNVGICKLCRQKKIIEKIFLLMLSNTMENFFKKRKFIYTRISYFLSKIL